MYIELSDVFNLKILRLFIVCCFSNDGEFPVDNKRPLANRTASQVPLQFREPYILTGYRPPYQKWSFYLKSVFRIHNETLNIWSHLVGAAYLTWMLIRLCQQHDVYNDVTSWPVVACNMGFLMCCLLSTTCHIFASRSEVDHHFFYQLDYIGIALSLQGSSIGVFFLSGANSFYETQGHLLLWLGWLLSVNVIICCNIGRFCYKRPYPPRKAAWNICSSFLSGIVQMLPVAHRIYVGLTSQNYDDLDVFTVVISACFYILGNVIFGAKVPERCCPGMFDIYGHSHTFFHIFIVLGEVTSTWAVHNDYMKRPLYVRMLGLPTFISVFGGFILSVIGGIVITWCTAPIRHKLANESTDKMS